MEPDRDVSDPARFWGLAKAKSEGRTKCQIRLDVKSTSHQDRGIPGKWACKGKQEGDLKGTGTEGLLAGSEGRH